MSTKEHNQFTLSNRDRDSFLAALDNPPAPNAALRAAAKKHGSKYCVSGPDCNL